MIQLRLPDPDSRSTRGKGGVKSVTAEKGKRDKKAAKQFDANALMLKTAFLKDDPAAVTLPIHSEAESVAEVV